MHSELNTERCSCIAKVATIGHGPSSSLVVVVVVVVRGGGGRWPLVRVSTRHLTCKTCDIDHASVVDWVRMHERSKGSKKRFDRARGQRAHAHVKAERLGNRTATPRASAAYHEGSVRPLPIIYMAFFPKPTEFEIDARASKSRVSVSVVVPHNLCRLCWRHLERPMAGHPWQTHALVNASMIESLSMPR